MAEKRTSCLGRLIRGCGCVFVLAAIIAAVSALTMHLSKPDPPRIEVYHGEERLTTSEHTLNLAGPETRPKPILLRLEVAKANLDILPWATGETAELEANYDAANFELNSDLIDHGGYLEYRLRFNSKNRLLYISEEHDPGLNRLQLQLPRNVPVNLDLTMKVGEAHVDLTGIPVSEIKARVSMGACHFRMAEENPLQMENMDMDMNIGEIRVMDWQHFRFNEGRFKASMGEVQMLNTGPLKEDSRIRLEVTMGQILLQIPHDTEFHGSVTNVMGGYEGPRTAEDSGGAKVVMTGKAIMGNIQVETGISKQDIADLMLDTIVHGSTGEALSRYELIKIHGSTKYRITANSLRRLGYRLMGLGRLDDARKILELNATEYPGNARAHRALADVYLNMGEYRKAMESVEKALSLDPDYSSARRLEKRIRAAKEEAEGVDP